jgi:hypothetical protein
VTSPLGAQHMVASTIPHSPSGRVERILERLFNANAMKEVDAGRDHATQASVRDDGGGPSV